MVQMLFPVLFAILFFFSSNASAEGKKEEVIKIGEVVVTATRTERKAEEVPASVTIITSEDIQTMQVTKTEEILKNVEGIDVRGFGGLLPGTVTLRGISPGFSGATTLIMVNGMAVEPILIDSRFTWNAISPDEIERIEVVRGPASALYGPNAVGGVINIVTKTGKGEPSASVDAGYGSHNSYSLGASVGGSLDKFNFLVGASQYETDGYKRIPQASPDNTIDLDGRDYIDRKYNARVGYSFSDDHEISLSLNYFDADGAWYGGRPNYRTSRYGYVLGADYRNQISSLVDFKAKLSFSDLKFDYTEDSYNPSVAGSSLNLTAKGYTEEKLWSGEVQSDLHLFTGNTLTAGVSYSPGEINRYRENGSGMQTWGVDTKSEVTGFYLQDEHKFGDRVIVTIGGRYDRFKFFDDMRYQTSTKTYKSFPESEDEAFNPRGGIRFNLTKDTSIWASAGTSYVPALNSLKYTGSTFFQDNPDLKPEKSVTYEVGLDQSIGGFLKGKTSFYHTNYKDRISAVSVGATTWPKQYRNVGETEVKGVELALEAALGDHWYPFVNYTYTDAMITQNPSDTTLEGKRSTFTPFNKFNVGVTYENPDLLTARVAGRFVGDRYWDDRNTEAKRLGDFFVMDAKVSKTFSIGGLLKDINASLAVNNVLDREYSEYGYYEFEDGRNYWGEVSFKF